MNHELDREYIIDFLKNFAEHKEYVNAMWLEGADGLGRVDEYSDIDFWFDVQKEYQESFLYECINELSQLGRIDSQDNLIRAEIAQSNIHLENTSEYLTLDLCVQSHEIRGLEATCYTKNDIAALPFILFDKKEIITFTDEKIDVDKLEEIFQNNKSRILQSSRVMKYIKRNQYLEAYDKYISNIAEPIVIIIRLIYTPRQYDYILCHINHHLPDDTVDEIQDIFKIASFEDIEKNIVYVKQLLEKYEKEFKTKYHR